ncbi:MAG: hypothetical protein V2I27_03990 [Erythrobacter sp.]|jgi:hypothetical protein|nr:hypothetical protein [Erythrobacter sp.]
MTLKTQLSIAIAAGLLGAPAVQAQDNWQNDMQASKERWEQVRNATVSAQELMSGDVNNNFNMLGDVRNLILDPTSSRLEYVLYDVPYFYSLYGDDDGFVRFDNVAIERGSDMNVDVRIDDEAYDFRKDQLELTRSQAQGRLVDDILDGEVRFSGGEMRGVDDVLFDPQSGQIQYFVVEMDDESLFGNDNRLVPASRVRYDQRGDYWTVSDPMDTEFQIWVY